MAYVPDRLALLCTKTMREIERKYPEAVGDAAEHFLMIYQKQLMESQKQKNPERIAAYVANDHLRIFYDNLENEQRQAYLASLDDEKAANSVFASEDIEAYWDEHGIDGYGLQPETRSTEPEEKQVTTKELFDTIKSEDANFYDTALEFWDFEYRQNYEELSDSIDEDLRKRIASSNATRATQQRYERYQSHDESHRDVSTCTYCIDDFLDYLDPLIESVRKTEPEFAEELASIWLSTYEKLQIVPADPAEYVDQTGVKIANRRVRFFYKKHLEQQEQAYQE